MMSYEFFNYRYITWGILRYHRPIFFIENRGNILPWLGTEHINKRWDECSMGGMGVPGGWEYQGGWVFQGDGSSSGMSVPGG